MPEDQEGPGEPRPSDEPLRLLAECARGLAVFTTDPGGRVTSWGPGAEPVFGYTGPEVVGRHAGRLFEPEGVDDVVARETAAAADRGRAEGERWHLRRDGTRFWAADVVTPLTGPDGRPGGFGVVVTDLSAVRREADALRLCEQRFRLLVDGVDDHAMFMMDPEGRIVHWNSGAERLKGYTEEEVLGRHLSFLYPKGSEDEAYAHLREAEESGSYRGEGERFRKDGTRFYARVVITSVKDESGRLWGFAKVSRDLTARRLLEADLAASEAQFRGIAEQSPALIWRADAEGRYDFLNRTWYEFRRRRPEDELGDGPGWAQGIHPDDRGGYLDASRAAFARREPFEATFRLRRHDGHYRWLTARGTPYRDDRGTFLGFLGSCLDITDRVELESLLQQQRELAEEASRHKTRLMSAMSHDARTPLNAVALSVELLEAALKGHPDPEVIHDLRTIRNAVGNVLDLLGDLLSLTRIDAGADPTVSAPFALEPVLVECLASIKAQARRKGLDVVIEPDGLAGLTVKTDRAKVKQVLCNLLSNALRYTERGHIRVYGTLADGQVRVSVEDTGVGIAPADQQRVFDEFARLEQPHRPAGEGTGLGLAICRRLASLLKGEITLESAQGRGSTFTLALPDSVLTSALPDAPRDFSPPQATGSGTILVAEDHLDSRQALAKVLRRMGYQVFEAANGRDAVEQARRERPLAVLMDVNMPVMDGIDATLALRADPSTREVPIFALTGDVTLSNRRRIGEAGIDGYLEKPVTREALEEALALLAR